MGSIIPRTDSKGKTTYQVKVRVRGYPTKTATFSRITDARRWEQQTEVAIKEGRYFDTQKKVEVLFRDVVDRYINEILVQEKLLLYAVLSKVFLIETYL